MVTFRPRGAILFAVIVALAGGCSREQQDWRSAEAADTSEAYTRFLEQHPDSELATQARARVEQLSEARDWAVAGQAATADAYRGFLAQHPNGKWAEEARIRIEAFSLGSAPRLAPLSPGESTATPGAAGVRALQMATVATPAPVQEKHAQAPYTQLIRAQPGDAAEPPAAAPPSRSASAAARAGGYGVQLGAFGSEASADREWRRLQGRFSAQLGGLEPRIVPAGGSTGQVYRLQAPASGEAQARALCASLREQAQPCVPVLPH